MEQIYSVEFVELVFVSTRSAFNGTRFESDEA